MISKKQIGIAFVAGALAFFALWAIFFSSPKPIWDEPVVVFDGAKLGGATLREILKEDLAPIASDEYVILKVGADRWLADQLIQKEAEKNKQTVEELLNEKVWAEVVVDGSQVREFYHQNRELFAKSLEEESQRIFGELRRRAYSEKKEKFVEQLKEKYHAKILLQKPLGYENYPLMPLVFSGGKNAADSKPRPVAPVPQPLPSPQPGNQGVVFNDLEGRPSMGPKEAPVTIVEFSDFHCPFCQRLTPTIKKIYEDYPGKVRVVWRHFPLEMHVGAERSHQASECAHDQGKFWEYHDKLFEAMGQPKDDSVLIGFARSLGLKVGQFKQCLQSEKHKELVKRDMQVGGQVGVRGTPASFINGRLISGAQPYEAFRAHVEGVLDPSKAPPPQERAPAPPAPPAHVEFNDLKGRPSLGPKKASVTLVEFSDFHCPFCQRVSPTLQQIMDNFKGKVRRVFRHYPLPMHPGAAKVHEASECAHDQGKFWNFYKATFEDIQKTKTEDGLFQIAGQIGLNKKKFKECLSSGRHQDFIQREIQVGAKAGVRGTPAVFVNGELVSGAYPYEHFEQLVQKSLDQ